MRRHALYDLAALGMGFPWYGALHLGFTGDFLKHPPFGLTAWETVSLLSLASWGTARLGRPWILQEGVLKQAFYLPFRGMTLFLWGAVLWGGALGRGVEARSTPEFLASLLVIPLVGMIYVFMNLPIVLPMGWVSQVVMQWVGEKAFTASRPSPPPARGDAPGSSPPGSSPAP